MESGFITFNTPPVIGQRVDCTIHDGPEGKCGGIYIGVALDEEDRVPYHYFIDGYINDTPQESHGFRAEEGTEVTTSFTPTELITSEISKRIKVRQQARAGNDGTLTLVVTKSVLVGSGLDSEDREIANYSLAYWPAGSEIVLTSYTGDPESGYATEIVYSAEVS
jgi:hypothetical protein